MMIAAYAPVVAPPSAQPPTLNLAPRDMERLADDLVAYHARFAPLFQRPEQRRAALVYLRGQVLDRERKTIEPLAHAVAGGNVQARQQFIGQSPWDAAAVLQAHQAYVGETRGDAEERAFIFDGCDVPKQGTASVGVARQWRHRGGQRRGRPGSRRGAGPGRLASSRHPERPRAALSGPGPPAARGGTRP